MASSRQHSSEGDSALLEASGSCLKSGANETHFLRLASGELTEKEATTHCIQSTVGAKEAMELVKKQWALGLTAGDKAQSPSEEVT